MRNCFWLIDDDEFVHLIMKKTIKNNNLDIDVTGFNNGLDAFEALNSIINENLQLPCVIFLDINMPICNGWCFLDKYKSLDLNIIKNISLFIFSSSIDPLDVQLADENPNVVEFIEKPVSLNKILKAIEIHKSRLLI